jgi:hypothetical protein
MARGNGGAAPGTKHTLTPRYAWGTPEEVAQRDKAGYQPEHPAFSQIPVGQSGGTGSFNDLGRSDHKRGDIKFNRSDGF